ncbi:MAG: hypothetical protein ACHQC8_04765 [Solirubrobacterales bacterium]
MPRAFCTRAAGDLFFAARAVTCPIAAAIAVQHKTAKARTLKKSP